MIKMSSSGRNSVESGGDLELSINFHESFASQTPRDLKLYKMAFEQAFNLMAEYLSQGIDLETAKRNVSMILEIDGKYPKEKTYKFR